MKFKNILIALFLALLSSQLNAQAKREIEVTAQGLISRVDQVMSYLPGQIKGNIKHIYPDGKSFTVDYNAYIREEDFLFNFSSSARGTELKVLYNMGGEDIWVYNVHSLRLFHKMGIDKYDSMLNTNFSFVDLSNADLQSNYSAEIKGEAFIKGIKAYRVNLNPIYRGGEYGALTLYVEKDTFVPLRIDYYDRDKVIFKFLTVAKTITRRDRIVPVRYDMMDIRKGTVTIFTISGFDENVNFDKELFRPERLGK